MICMKFPICTGTVKKLWLKFSYFERSVPSSGPFITDIDDKDKVENKGFSLILKTNTKQFFFRLLQLSVLMAHITNTNLMKKGNAQEMCMLSF